MADLLCVNCAEPLDMDELHEIEGMTFDEAYTAYRRNGCVGIGLTCSPILSETAMDRAAMASAIYDVLGDDVDGAASELEDLFG